MPVSTLMEDVGKKEVNDRGGLVSMDTRYKHNRIKSRISQCIIMTVNNNIKGVIRDF